MSDFPAVHSKRPHCLIIGGGIIGSAVARELAGRKRAEILVLEKEPELAAHASGRNSGVLHSGINQKPGSLKARMCVAGSRLARAFCTEYGVRTLRCGTLVVARNDTERATLEQLLQMGTEAGVLGLRIIDRSELAEREPDVKGDCALLSPEGAIVDSAAFTRAVAAAAERLGARYSLGEKVLRIEKGNVITTRGEHRPDHVINCAGLHADRIARMMGTGEGLRIIPFRGEYMEIRRIRVNSMVYQAPDLRYPFLGVHFTRTVDGEVLAGPTAMLSFGRESYEKQIDIVESLAMLSSPNFWRLTSSFEFLRLLLHNGKISFSERAFLEEIRTLWRDARPEDIHPWRSGIRAQMVDRSGRMVDDMRVEFLDRSTHVLNAVSPGMTSALAFAGHVVDNMNFPG